MAGRHHPVKRQSVPPGARLASDDHSPCGKSLTAGNVSTKGTQHELHVGDPKPRTPSIPTRDPGHRPLDRLSLNPISTPPPDASVPELWRQKLRVGPLPRNMDPSQHTGRRLA
ncbi:hypothetical protein HPB50_003684 [Hyalomma asiaticum]|uniref:Uncharacterized protein n=1 Tax=Hyalomma asiaticum TaxID=266040 RepID=A0ACB7SRY5_HYAAI|nr:hypothetical protein HPB50_003684 [Hyalomma asiaticum]